MNTTRFQAHPLPGNAAEIRAVDNLAYDVRPLVAKRSSSAAPWLFGIGTAIAALLLFFSLDARRKAAQAPSTSLSRVDEIRTIAAPPPLYVPPEISAGPQPASVAPPLGDRLPLPSVAEQTARNARLAPRNYDPSPVYTPTLPPGATNLPLGSPLSPFPIAAPPPSPPIGGGRLILVDGGIPVAGNPRETVATRAAVLPSSRSQIGDGAFPIREAAQAVPATAGAFRVPQGTLIPAVMETALDSTRPGQTRAVVQRDVRGFDGTRVLIPRGSRLFGEYRADLAPGQNRALVQWTRLVRPDGSSIALDSPASDPLGRAGVRGKVNSHFFERFGAAILQSTLDLGVSVAARSVGSGPVVVVPGGGFGGASPLQTRQVQPTLTVRQGARVAVFVARDLDFSTAGAAP